MDIDITSKKYSLNTIEKLISDGIEALNEDELIISLYMPLPSRIKPISDKIEKLLLLAKLNKIKFKENFKSFIKDIVLDIKNNNTYEYYYEFVYIVYVHLRKCGEGALSTIYMSLIAEIYHQLAPEDVDIWAFDIDGKPIYKHEPYLPLDEILNALYNKKNANMNKLKIYDFNGDNNYKLGMLTKMERVYSNTLSLISGVLDENDLDIYPDEKKMAINAIYPKIRIWNQTNVYKDLLKEKKYILPKDGVKCIFENTPNIKEIYFKEKLFLDYIVLIFKVTHEDGMESTGMCIPSIDFYMDICITTSFIAENTYENFILEVYSILTTEMDLSHKKMSAIHITDDINNPSGYYKQQPIMQVFKKEIETIYINKKSKTITNYKNYNKTDYISINISVAPYIRKLPVGYSVSEEAISLALKYGYKLKEGETFVSPFKKNVRHKIQE